MIDYVPERPLTPEDMPQLYSDGPYDVGACPTHGIFYGETCRMCRLEVENAD